MDRFTCCRGPVFAVVAGVALLGVACGSTVPEPLASGNGSTVPERLTSGDGRSAALGDGSVDGGLDSSLGEEAAAGRMPSAMPGTRAGSRTDQTAQAGAPAGPATRGGLLPAADGVQGVDDATIKIGLVTQDSDNGPAAPEALGGAAGDNTVNEDASWEKLNAAALEMVNSRGGIAGRRVEPVYYKPDATQLLTATGRQQESQRACSRWTEDDQVFAFGPLIMAQTEVLVECAAKTRTPLLSAGIYLMPISERRFQSMANYWYSPDFFVADRRERAMARFMLNHGFFGSGAKVGLMVEDKADIREAVARNLKPELARAGLKPVVEIFYPDHLDSPWANYVLQLQMAGVTHIVWSTTSIVGFPQLLMMRAAENQQYRPKWALGSDNGPTHVRDLDAPREQLANVQVMGWRPNHELYTDDAPPESANAQLCNQAMARYSQPKGHRQALSACEMLLFLKAAFEQATEVSPAGLARGVGRLGATYPSTLMIGGATRFAPGRHDGVEVVRNAAWDRKSEKFVYTTAAEPVPD